MPGDDDVYIGSHAMLLTGFDDEKGFEVCNSWHVNDKPLHYIDFKYIESYFCFDFIIIDK